MNVLADVVIRPFQLEDADGMLALEEKYRALYPDQAKTWLLAYRYSPVFREPGNNYSVFDQAGRMIAYCHVHPLMQEDDEPLDEPHRLFLYHNVDVDFAEKDALRELLYGKLLERCAELARSYGEGRR